MKTVRKFVRSRGLGAASLMLMLATLPASPAVAAGAHLRGAQHAMATQGARHLTAWHALPSGLAAALHRALAHTALSHGLSHQPMTTPFSGTTWSQQAVLTAPGTGDLGDDVAVSGTTALVGNPGAGAAFVFVQNGSTWSLQQEITPTGAAANSYFGIALAVWGDTAVVGAPGTNNHQGAAYVFVRSGTTWTQQQELSPTHPVSNTGFGASVAINGDTILVGTSNFRASGAAYVFVRSGTSWVVEAKLTANDGGVIDYFGSHVALSGNTAVIDAFTGPIPSGVGEAYVFVRSGTRWSQQALLLDPTGQANDGFGDALSLSGNTVAIGAANRDAAYIFVRSGTGSTATWAQQAELTAPSGANFFGGALALSGNTVIIGAAGTNGNVGAAYVYVRGGTTWGQQATLTGSCTIYNSSFGSAVGLSGNTAVIGATGQGSCSKGGAAYVFVRG